ncbi:MAG: HigA family addiction module antidote protein [Proteobacteria bacterium]|nr:HigA family addiction module antidote protein [Pseudomonadota bacterium]
MSITTKGKMHSPAHPGEVLREMYLKPMKVSVTEAARALGVSRKHVSSIVNGRAPVTPDMAMRLAAVFATEAQLWVNLQAQHDLWVVSEKTPPKVRPLRQAA